MVSLVSTSRVMVVSVKDFMKICNPPKRYSTRYRVDSFLEL